MTLKLFYKVLSILLGFGLIIGGFIIFGSSLDDKVKILDIIVSCLIFIQFALFLFFPLIKMDNSAHREVGMLGIHLYVLNICSILSIAIMVFGIIFDWAFKYQIMAQLAVLLLIVVGRIATLHSGEKVQHIYEKEQIVMSGKSSLKNVMEDFMEYLACTKEIDSELIQKLNAINESMRFISPSARNEACELDAQFCQSIEDLKVLMRNPSINETNIVDEVAHLERILSRRKKY